MEKVRVGISGPGHNHAFAVGNCEEGELAAVCDLSDERRDAYVADYKKWMGAEAPDVPKVKLIDDLLADPEIEAVVIALSNSLRLSGANAKRETSPPCNDWQNAEPVVTCQAREYPLFESRTRGLYVHRSNELF
jgi:hypothetical protein